MRRTFAYFTSAIIFCLLMLTFSLPMTRTVKADSQDRCVDCTVKVEEKYNRCIARNPTDPTCGDEYNEGIVHCYRHWCEG